MEHLNITNTFGFDYENFYEWIVDYFPNGSRFVEVGVGTGKSAGYLAVTIINSNKTIKLDCVDCFDMKDIPNQDLTKQFRDNLSPVWDKLEISIIQNFSVEASKSFQDKSLDFVFIDADHSYNAVTADINSWLPKLKNTGILAGHDYTEEYKNSVVPAVNDFFGKLNVPIHTNGSCWYVFCKNILY